MWEEPGIKTYIVNLGGEFSLHNDLKGPWTPDYFHRLDEVFDSLCFCLMDRGWKYLETWIKEGDERNYRFSQRFGFVDTGTLKQVKLGDSEFLFRVMRYDFPDLSQLTEGVRD